MTEEEMKEAEIRAKEKEEAEAQQKQIIMDRIKQKMKEAMWDKLKAQ